MLKDTIVTMGDGNKYYIAEDIMFENGDYYCCGSLYNEETQDCSDDFKIFSIEKNEEGEMVFFPEYDKEIINQISKILLENNE